MKIHYVISIHLMRWLTNFYDFRFKSTATAAIGIHPNKAWMSLLVIFKNAIWTWGHFRRTICNKICFKLGKNATETYGMHQTAFGASCKRQFLSSIRDSRKAGSLWGRMRGVGGVRKSIHQSWLAKGLGLGLLWWGFKGVQEEIPSEEASISSNRVSGISTWTMYQSTTPSLSQTIWARWASRQFLTLPCVFWLFPKLRGCRYETIEEMKEAVTKVIDTLTQEDFHWTFQKLVERYNKCVTAGGLAFHVCTINKSAHTKKVWKLIKWSSYLYIYI